MAHTITSEPGPVHGQHRATDWSAAAWAGLVAGVAFMMVEMVMVMLVQGGSPWDPPRMMAAMVLGPGALEGPPGFDSKVMMTAMAIHVPLSIAYGLIVGWLVHRLSTGAALLVGAVFGVAIYLGNFYPVADAAFPWFAMARGWLSAAAHLLFGLIAAAAYAGLRRA